MKDVFEEIRAERARQDEKFGQQDHLHCLPGANPHDAAWYYEIPTEEEARNRCEEEGEEHRLTWAAVAVEEVAEAVGAAAAGDRKALREELVQCAAVFVAWVEALDRETLADIAVRDPQTTVVEAFTAARSRGWVEVVNGTPVRTLSGGVRFGQLVEAE